MTYANEVQNKTGFQTNIVCEIEGTYFAKHQIDSGFTIDSDKLILSSASINPSRVDLKRSITTVANVSLKILDFNGVFSAFMGGDDGALTGKEINLYVGRNTGSFDWSDYVLIRTYVIRDIDKSLGFYTVKAKSQVGEMQKQTFTASGDLKTSINDNDSTLVITTETDIFSDYSILKIDDEYISYNPANVSFDSGALETTITSVSRADQSSQAAAHVSGTNCVVVHEISENPIDAILKLWISGGGGGTYDVYPDGIGLDPNLIDITAVEAVRDTYHATDTFTLRPTGVANTLKYIQDHLLIPNNLRIVENIIDNKLSIAKMDEVDITADVQELDEDNTKPIPRWSISSRDIQNVIRVQYAWSDGLQKYTRFKTFRDEDSIAKYGEKTGRPLNVRGAQVAQSGDDIAEDRALKFLARFSTPLVFITATTSMKVSLFNVGDKIRFTNKHLPQAGGGLGLSAILEILQVGVNYSSGEVKIKMAYTSYSNTRFGFISPSPLISNIQDQKTFDVPDGSCYKVGWRFQLWDTVSKSYVGDPVNEIANIDGNTITMLNDFTTTLTTDMEFHFANYNDLTAEQIAKYCAIADNTNIFDDDAVAYKIIL